MQVFIGTMESGEADFEQCKAAILGQRHAKWTHFIVSGLPEAAAHRRLYEEWNAVKADFDLFIKVDADTVLANPFVVEAYVRLFRSDLRLTGVQAWLDDYMTRDLIYGLTCVRNSVRISTDVDPLFCDRVDTGHDRILRGSAVGDPALIPAGRHCHHASKEQAFRYGVHRAKKRQAAVRDKVRTAWISQGRDEVRGMALAGFDLASSCPDVDYGARGFQDAFAEATARYGELSKGWEER
jgi:hypothetical protein